MQGNQMASNNSGGKENSRRASALIHSQAFSIFHYSLIKLEIKLSTSVHGSNYLQLCIVFNFNP